MGHDQPRYSPENTISHPGLLLRADASTQIGSGHVMRCLALAQAWQEQGGGVVFAADVPGVLRARLEAEGMTVHALSTAAGSDVDAQQVIDLAQQLATRFVVVDGYQFGADYQRWLKEAGLRLLVLDDNGEAQCYSADLVLNQNIHANESLYTDRKPYTRLLLGTRYALLRREFWAWRGWQRDIPDVARNVLVTMGGSDPDNVTLAVLRGLEQVQMSDLHVKVVVGGSNPHYDALQTAVRHSSHEVELALDVSDMPALMAWADMAISAGGSTCWELAFMGVPSAIIVLAANQRAIAEHLAQRGVVRHLGWHADVSPGAIASALARLLGTAEQRCAMSTRGRELVDSRGGERVVKALRQSQLSLRPATQDDCRLIFDWANNPLVREMSFSSDPISWDVHVVWFKRTLRAEHTLFWIAEDDSDKPIGQVRFVLDDKDATISISLDPLQRGKGYGATLIEQASWHVLDQHHVNVIHAYIKPGNAASERTFEKAGYSLAPPIDIQGQPALHMILEKT